MDIYTKLKNKGMMKMKVYETVEKELTLKRVYELGFKEPTEITQGAMIQVKGLLKKNSYHTWYIKIEDTKFVYIYFLNSRGQSLKIMNFFENTVKNKEDVYRVLELAKFKKIR